MLGLGRVMRVLPYSWREGRQTPQGKKQRHSNLKNSWGTREIIHSSWSISLKGSIYQHTSLGKKKVPLWHHFPALQLNINTELHAGSSLAPTLATYLAYTKSQVIALLNQVFLSLSVAWPHPRRPAQSPPHTTSLKPGLFKSACLAAIKPRKGAPRENTSKKTWR